MALGMSLIPAFDCPIGAHGLAICEDRRAMPQGTPIILCSVQYRPVVGNGVYMTCRAKDQRSSEPVA